MWQSNASVDEWLLRTPNNTLYLFQSYEPTEESVLARMLALSSLIVSRLETLGDAAYASQVLGRLYFANETIDVDAPTNWMSGLLTTWQSTTNTLTASGVADSSETIRFNCTSPSFNSINSLHASLRRLLDMVRVAGHRTNRRVNAHS